MEWPIGKQEDLHNEFKAADALARPAVIARALVGFLNAEGGDVWVGIREDRSVAVEAEAIVDPQKQLQRLQDALVDLVEPAPRVGRDLDLEVVPFPGAPDRGLIRIRISKGPAGPYALLNQGGRVYLTRTGARQRPMTREEIAGAFAEGHGQDDAAAAAVESVLNRLPPSPRVPSLRVVVQPVEKLALDLSRAELEPLLRTPVKTGNRLHGWSFTSDRDELQPFNRGPGGSGWQLGTERSYQRLQVTKTGTIEFSARLERLHWKGPEKSLWPYPLLEFPTSVLRLARALYLRASPRPDLVALGLGLFGIMGWTLKPHSPASVGFLLAEERTYEQAEDFISNPIVATWAELQGEPDRCAHRLVKQVYEAFGFDEHAIPVEFDIDSGRLTFPP